MAGIRRPVSRISGPLSDIELQIPVYCLSKSDDNRGIPGDRSWDSWAKCTNRGEHHAGQ